MPATKAARNQTVDIAIGLALMLSVFAVYAQVTNHDFVNLDDNLYVYENPHVLGGLTAAGFRWALTAVVASNWMPVTLLSHMLDVQLFGPGSGPMHVVNVVLHALSAVVLFLVLRRATGARWPSAFVAFAFALHPLHVESVAWIAERKDVLSVLLWFLALYAYVLYAERPGRARYAMVVALFALGLMAKPMLVTFPFTLLLFDKWPLRRFQWPKVVWEKLPLFALSATASVVSYFVQQSAGAVKAISFSERLENALISYVTYIGQTLWPARLAIFYPYPRAIEAWQAVAAMIVIAGVSWLAIQAWRTRPYIAVGWFWYLGTLVPVIGLVQVGSQAHADRYTYIPMVGLTLILAWGAADIAVMWPGSRRAIVGAAALCCAAWMAVSISQAAYWQNSETVFRHAIDVTGDNWFAEYNLGHYLMDQPGRLAESIPHFEAVLRIYPDYPEANNNLGACLMNSGRPAEAIARFEAAIRARPDFADAHFNLGLDLTRLLGRAADAETELKAALHLDPDHEQAHNTLALLLVQQGRVAEAIPHFEAVLRLHPDYRAEHNLGAVLAMIPGKQADAIAHLEAAQRLHPDTRNIQLIQRLRANTN